MVLCHAWTSPERTIHGHCTDICIYFLQCCKYCFFTALSIQFWCLYSLRNFFFTVTLARLSLPTNNSFFQEILHFCKRCENILTSYRSLMAWPVTPPQISHHDYQWLFPLAYILSCWLCWLRKVWAFILSGFTFIHLSQRPYHPKIPQPATCSELWVGLCSSAFFFHRATSELH